MQKPLTCLGISALHTALCCCLSFYAISLSFILSGFYPPPPTPICMPKVEVCVPSVALYACAHPLEKLDHGIERFWWRQCCLMEVKYFLRLEHEESPHQASRLCFDPSLLCWVEMVEDASSSLSRRTRPTRQHQVNTVVECRTTCFESSATFCSRYLLIVIHSFHSALWCHSY